MDGDSFVGDVYSYDGQANLDRSNGKANDDNGVGLSMGRILIDGFPPATDLTADFGCFGGELMESSVISKVLRHEGADMKENNLVRSSSFDQVGSLVGARCILSHDQQLEQLQCAILEPATNGLALQAGQFFSDGAQCGIELVRADNGGKIVHCTSVSRAVTLSVVVWTTRQACSMICPW